MKTKTNISADTITHNGLSSHSSFVLSLIAAGLLFVSFIGLTNQIDTGIDMSLLTQQIYKLQLFA